MALIVADMKPVAEVVEATGSANKILVVGCGACVSVCLAGGEKEVGVLAAALRIVRRLTGRPVQTVEVTMPRQCDPEYMDGLAGYVTADVDCIVSLACGVGVQFCAERFECAVIPALNTRFAGGAVAHGVWEERCALCGECILAKTGGICPITRCAKGMLNGPCGGSQDGNCEVNGEKPCAWQLIHDRLQRLGGLDQLVCIEPPKDWSKARDGGPRVVVNESVMLT
jgi:ferredoxin